VATDYESLVPIAQARELISAAAAESAVLALGHTLTMPSGVERVPVLSVAPTASFVSSQYGGKKPYSAIEWTSENLQAEEIALVTYIPTAFVDDSEFPVWDSVKTETAAAIARAIDSAVLYGTGAPASYPAGGIAALAGAAETAADALTAIDESASIIEASGLTPTGIAAGSRIGSALRAAYRDAMALPGEVPAPTVYGLPVIRTASWDDSHGDALVGDWSKLVVGIREDIRFDLSDSATITDGSGNIIASMFESDSVALRCFMRIGVVVGLPVAPGGGTVVPFSFSDWTAGSTARSTTRSSKASK
jgi:hypothetical protein